MAKQPSGPAPKSPPSERGITRIWPTPNEEDLLFFVARDGTLPKNDQTWEYGDPFHDDPVTYPNHVLIYVSPEGPDGRSKWYYASNRLVEDAYNWEFSQADIGGRKFDSVLRTYLVPRADFEPMDPGPGDLMPNTPAGKFTGSYILAGRQQVRTGDEIFDSLFVVDRRNYVRRVTIKEIAFDDALGTTRLTTETLYYYGEVPDGGDSIDDVFASDDDSFWGVQNDGAMRTGRQLSAHWYLVTSRGVAPNMVNGVGTIREYNGYVNQSLPAVLHAITFDLWERTDGGYRNFPQVYYKRMAFSGEIRAAISEKFYINQPTREGLQHLMPLPLVISCPFFSVSIGPTLHAADTLTLGTGTEDPVWEYTGGNYHYPSSRLVTEGATLGDTTASDISDWPDSLQIADDLQPFRGGWLRREITLDLTHIKKGFAVYP